MANPVKGEVGFDHAGKSYTFKLGTYALAVLQRKTGVPTMKFFQREEGEWGVSDILSVFHAALHRDHKMSEEEVADLIDDLGEAKITEIFNEGLKLAFGVDRGKPVDPQ